jgi:hypothetical protein
MVVKTHGPDRTLHLGAYRLDHDRDDWPPDQGDDQGKIPQKTYIIIEDSIPLIDTLKAFVRDRRSGSGGRRVVIRDKTNNNEILLSIAIFFIMFIMMGLLAAVMMMIADHQ